MDDDGTDDYAEEDLKMDMDTDTWNEPDAFEKFILDVIPPPNFHQVCTRIRFLCTTSNHTFQSQDSTIASTLASTPSLVPDSSSPVRITDVFPSSPYASSSPVRKSMSRISSLAFSASSFPKYTPAPPPAQRKRVAYLQKRIERSKHKGKNPFNVSDEEGTKSTAVVAEKPTGPKDMDGRILTREQAMAIIGADDDVEEV